jgi:hypothetical protein
MYVHAWSYHKYAMHREERERRERELEREKRDWQEAERRREEAARREKEEEERERQRVAAEIKRQREIEMAEDKARREREERERRLREERERQQRDMAEAQRQARAPFGVCVHLCVSTKRPKGVFVPYVCKHGQTCMNTCMHTWCCILTCSFAQDFEMILMSCVIRMMLSCLVPFLVIFQIRGSPACTACLFGVYLHSDYNIHTFHESTDSSWMSHSFAHKPSMLQCDAHTF